MTSPDLGPLREALGDDLVREHAPIEVDGAALSVTLAPADAAGLAVAAGALGRLSLAAVVRGAGTQLGMGNVPRRADVLLSTGRVAGVDDFDPGEGVCHVGAGTPLASVREAVEAEGWELGLDSTGTVGGALAAASLGPRSQGFGRPRDVLLGLEVALASGELVKSGGRVVKNVTGYDMNKLYTGSFGALGVIAGAWLRLRPRPERSAVFEAVLPDLPSACERGLAAARRATARAAALSGPADGGFSLVVELAGNAPSVERDAAWLRDQTGAHEARPEVLDRVRALQVGVPGEEGLRFRIAALPSRIGGALAALPGAALLAYPGLGLGWARFPLVGEDARAAADAAWSTVAAVARETGGTFRLEDAPVFAKQDRDVFGDESGAQPLVRALKDRFDPARVLNPGRFAGRL